jgi:hypothetical protein
MVVVVVRSLGIVEKSILGNMVHQFRRLVGTLGIVEKSILGNMVHSLDMVVRNMDHN